MNQLSFSIAINASSSNIWNALWDETHYREWAGVFFEGSYLVVNNWEVGSIVHFMGEDRSGIFSQIETHIPDKQIQFRHLGNVLNGEEQAIDEETKKWSGAKESYSVNENEDGSKTLTLTLNVMDEHLEFMNEKTPIALEKIKEISERN